MNILKIKCHVCNDVLTDGEMKTHFFKTRGSKLTCYWCSKKQWEAKVKNSPATVQGAPTKKDQEELEEEHYKNITNFEYL